MSSKNNFSTIISVCLFILVGTVITFIMTLNTIEADKGFTLAAKEVAAVAARDQNCPFTAAERDDLLATDSIRQYVNIIDVYCDEENGKEKVTIEYQRQDDAE